MKTNLLLKRLLLLWVFAFSTTLWGQTTTFFNFTSSYVVPPAADWSSEGSGVAGGSYLKLSPGSVTSPLYDAATSVVFKYDIAAFGSGASNTLTKLTVLDASNDVIQELTLTVAPSSTYVKNQTINVGAISSKFRVKIEGFGDGISATSANKGTRLQNYSLAGTLAPTCTTSEFSFASSTVNKITGDLPFTNTFTTDNTSPTVYASSNTNVATVSSTGEVTIVAAGSTIINVTQITDGTHCAVTASYSLSVTSNVKPIITAPSAQSVTVGVPYSYQIVASENPTSYAIATGSLPTGLSLNSSTGVISGTPTQAGTFNTTLTATNAAGPSDAAVYEITVDKGTQTIASLINLTKNLSDGSVVFPVNSDNTTLQITYSSSDETVATVSGNTVDLLKLGSTTITAIQGGDDNWNPFEKQITLTITTEPVILAAWDFYGESISDQSTAEFIASNLDPASNLLTRGPDAPATSAGNTFRTNGFKNIPISVSNTAYFENIIKVKEGYKVSLGEIKARLNGTASYLASPGVSSQYGYSLDGTNFTLIGSPTIVTSANADISVDLSGVAALQNIDSNTTIYLRYYASGQTTTGGWGYSSASSAGTNGLEILGNISVDSTVAVWNGASWSNVDGPDENKNAIIDADYSGDSFESKYLKVNSGKTLTVPSTGFVKTENVYNYGNILVSNNGNFVQTGTFDAFGSSTFKVNRTTKPVLRLDYNSWSSPIMTSDQLLKDFSDGTLPTRFLTYSNLAFVPVPNIATAKFIPGAGYLIRTPNGYTEIPEEAVAFQGQFIGTVPNSGNVSYTPNDGGPTDQYVFLGNPYPSAISMEDFHIKNEGQMATGAFYIWNSESKMNASNVYVNPYNTHTAAGSNPYGAEFYVPVGQGFLVDRGEKRGEFLFTNSMRRTDQTGTFAKSAVTDRFWLQMTSPTGLKPQLLVGFTPNATSGFDAGFDGKLLESNGDVIYSTVDNKSLVINALGTFSSTDVINVTANFASAGNYTIDIAQKEGVFANGQQIYLKDNITGIETELTSANYTFAATAGLQADRFTVSFSKGVLASSNTTKAQSTIYADHQVVHVKGASKIASVEVYDMSGKLVKTSKNVISENTSLAVAYKGVAVVKVVLENGEVVTKKVILK